MLLSIFSNMVHMVAYFQVVRTSGAVTVGVLKASQAVGTFLVSAVFFCERQASQCFTLERGMATMIVCLGVVLYSFTKTVTATKRRVKEAQNKWGWGVMEQK